MKATSIDIASLLEADPDMGLAVGVNMYIGKEPSTPSQCVTIFDTQGYSPQLNLISQGYEYPSVQIRVRAVDFQTAWTIIETIKTKLHGLAQQTINGTLYSVIYCASGPALLDWDDNSRARVICNFNIQRR